MDDRHKNHADEAIDKAKEMGEETIENGYRIGREYADAGLEYASELGDSLRKFVRREPWIALTAACVIGYLAARILRSTKS